MQLIMRKPTAEDESAVQAFMDSFTAVGEAQVNGSAGLDINRDYSQWLAYLARIEAGDKDVFVPSVIYLAKNPDGEVVGILDVRPTLPEEKLAYGHIGYSVAPGHRREGVARQMLQFGTKLLTEAGVVPIIACCYSDNSPSVATLESGGYQRAGYYTDENDGIVLIFHGGESRDIPMVSNGQ